MTEAADNEPRDRRRIKELEVMVAAVVPQTSDSVTLVFFTGNDRLDYRAGHFLTIDPHQFEHLGRFISFCEDLKGRREPARAYSMSSAPHEKQLAVTVKEERYVSGLTKYPPILSPFLVRALHPGTRMTVTGFTGPYTLPDDIESQTDHLVHVCAGSGSVPNLSILKFALHAHPGLRHTFLYSNRSWNDVIFREELHDLERRHPEQVKVIHTLTREAGLVESERRRAGRLSVALLREWIPDVATCRVFACGPAVSVHDRVAAKAAGQTAAPRFLESAMDALAELGVPRAHITRESYG